METDIIRKLFIAIAAFSAVVAISYLIGRRDGQNLATINESERVDTLFIFDTITQYKPILEERIKLEKVLIPVTDTLWIHDTIFMILEREQVIWEDSLSRVYASGVMTQIDSVQHFVKERLVTMELAKVVKKPCRWGLGVQAGYGIQVGDQIKSTPYIGIGLSYNLFSW